MIFVHEKNINNKIETNYHGLGNDINDFYLKQYLPFRHQLSKIAFEETNRNSFVAATTLFNQYSDELKKFEQDHPMVKSQSKFCSTFLEEMSVHLFKGLKEIQQGVFGIYNKGIFAGLRIKADKTIELIKKDVDFCIGKEVSISIDNQNASRVVLPVVAVEVKTYLDATMFGEVRSSSRAIRNASPNAKTYVLMGYKSIADAHIIAARNDSAITEMFVLREGANDPMNVDVIWDYWREIRNEINRASTTMPVNTIGRLINSK